MNEKVMSEKVDEQISALVDGELGSDEQEFLLRRLAQDKGLQGKWDRYHLMSDALQNHLPERVDADLAHRISNALEKEDALHGGKLSSNSSGVAKRLVKSVAGLSIAASVAVFSIIGIQQYNLLQLEEGAGSVSLASNALSPVANQKTLAANATIATINQTDVTPVYVRVSGTRWTHERSQVGSRLNNYLVNHNEYTSATNLQGLVNYTRIAGYDVKK